jgi:hypothetical protein
VYDCELLCAGLLNFIPCEFCSQLSCKVPAVVLSPLICKPAALDVDTKLVFAFVTVESLGVPISRTLPNAKTKSIESDDARLEENVSVELLTVYELPAFCIEPFSDTIK